MRLANVADYGCVCPICLMPLRPSELESHAAYEMENLAKLSAAVLSSQKGMRAHPPPLEHHGPVGGPFGPLWGGGKQMSPKGVAEVAPRSRWDVSERDDRRQADG